MWPVAPAISIRPTTTTIATARTFAERYSCSGCQLLFFNGLHGFPTIFMLLCRHRYYHCSSVCFTPIATSLALQLLLAYFMCSTTPKMFSVCMMPNHQVRIRSFDSDTESGAKATLKAVVAQELAESFSCRLQDKDFTVELIFVATSLRHQGLSTGQGRRERRLLRTLRTAVEL